MVRVALKSLADVIGGIPCGVEQIHLQPLLLTTEFTEQQLVVCSLHLLVYGVYLRLYRLHPAVFCRQCRKSCIVFAFKACNEISNRFSSFGICLLVLVKLFLRLSLPHHGITFKSVLVAMGQAFYSLSLGMGIMITYGSYTGKEVNLVRSTAMVCVFDTVVALLAGLAIFPSVAHFDPSLLGSSKGVALMFIILPQVFESMGSVGQVVSFAFFVMVDIAAITSVVSLIEVVTQFVIQKFHVHRKRAALVVACVCFAVSIPIGISLGHVAILEESSPALFGLDWLTFFDEVTNTVLMPVCALFSCIVVGWFITPKRAVAEIEAEGTHMAGWLKKVYAVMIRFVTPALILIVEIGGLQSEIAAGNTAVIVFAYALVALCVVAYFALFRNRDTGTNADEKLSGDYPV